MPTVLVTGPNGLLGSTLVRVLREAGMTVHEYAGDIREAEKLRDFTTSLESLDAVVHTAAVTDVNRCEQEQTWCTEVNVLGTKNVRDAAATRGAKLIYVSTASVFSGLEGNYHENDEPDPRNHYNRTKAEGERMVRQYDKSLILRVNLIGLHPAGSRGKNFMEWLVDSVRGNKDMRLFTDIRINPLSNWTLAETIRDMLVKWPDEKILHLGSRTVLSKADIGRMLIEQVPEYRGTAEYVNSESVTTTAFRPKEMWLNVDTVQRLGFTMPTLESEISRILNNV